MNKNKIIIKKLVYKDGKYLISFEVPNTLKQYFYENTFWMKCQQAGQVPSSVALVPVASALLPFAWLFDCELKVPELDKAFVQAVPRIRHGYEEMLSKVSLAGNISVDKIVDNTIERNGDSLLLFSGGVDAWCTLARHLDENPHLVTIWGADIHPENTTGWKAVNRHSAKAASAFSLQYSYIQSNFRAMFNEHAINEYLYRQGLCYNWWHDFQHGIGLLSLTAPLSFVTGSSRTYIASSFTERDKGTYTCASDPTIDNMFRCCNMRGIHDGYELTRQNKLEVLSDFVNIKKIPVDLRVCFHVQSGDNCCRCEKCGRTILGIYSVGGNPTKFGFSFNHIKLCILSLRMLIFYIMNYNTYQVIAESARNNKENIPKCFFWIFSDNLEIICNNAFKERWNRLHAIASNIYHKVIKK